MTQPTSPAFVHAPMIGRWSMIGYEGGPPHEYNFGNSAWTAKRAARWAHDEAFCSMRRRVVVRSPGGAITYDGPVLNEAGMPIFRPGSRELAA